MSIKEMTREDFVELFDMQEDEMYNFDSYHEEGMSWYEIAYMYIFRLKEVA